METVLIAAPLILVAMLWPMSVIGRNDARRARQLAVIERRLKLVMDHLGIEEPAQDHPEVVRELEQGRKIQAIKAYRQATGATLAQAKTAVEEIANTRGL